MATDPTPAQLAEQLEQILRGCGRRERAEGSKAYLKSDLEFFGNDTPTLRRSVKGLLGEHPLERSGLVALIEILWLRPVFELRLAAVEIAIFGIDQLEAGDLVLVERLIRDSETWALVDALAPRVAGPLLHRHSELVTTIDRWAEDDDLWLRRSALLVDLLLLRRGEGDFSRFAGYADSMLEEKEFFIRKAIGWVLREVGKKRPQVVVEWLLPRAGRAARLTVREAVKYLPEADRDAILEANGLASARRARTAPPSSRLGHE